ncbi:hypothetical protein F5B21DRAFT_454466 [Xylaria acuta]|nr:hypothetical protein F5B21DRAFT_454466 [Xylaria acuta]
MDDIILDPCSQLELSVIYCTVVDMTFTITRRLVLVRFVRTNIYGREFGILVSCILIPIWLYAVSLCNLPPRRYRLYAL